MIAEAIASVACTRIGDITLGRTYLMMIQRSGRPIALAPSMYSSLRMAITAARQAGEDRHRGKADGDHRVRQARAQNAPSAIAMIRNGQASSASITREMTPSHIFWK